MCDISHFSFVHTPKNRHQCFLFYSWTFHGKMIKVVLQKIYLILFTLALTRHRFSTCYRSPVKVKAHRNILFSHENNLKFKSRVLTRRVVAYPLWLVNNSVSCKSCLSTRQFFLQICYINKHWPSTAC